MRRDVANSKPCSVEGCNRELVAHGYCDAHYTRLRTYGDVRADIPVRPRRKAVTSYLSKDGYRYVRDPQHPNADSSGFVLEHRKVMSDELGRPLHPDETVHHRNGIRTDNRTANLELRTGHHGAGQAIEDQVEWAIQMLSEYAPCVLAENVADSDVKTAQYLAELELEMNRFRGRLLGALEAVGMAPVQERGIKAILKSLSYDAQAELAAILVSDE